MPTLGFALFASGLLQSHPVQVAMLVGGVTALVSGAVGVLTVIRGQSFAGHALADVGSAGGSGAFLLGINPLLGFVASGLIGAGVMEAIGVRRERGRDLATGIVLGAALGMAALFLYWDATYQNTTGATVNILFGSMFTISASTTPLVVCLSVVVLGIVVSLYRPLLLSSVSPDIAVARGVPVRLISALHLLAMALAVALACVTIGATLSTALLVGPPAAALRVSRRPGRAVFLAGLIGVACTWLGIVLAYDSYNWPPQAHGWPVSFFVVTLVFVVYLLAGLRRPPRRAAVSPTAPVAG